MTIYGSPSAILLCRWYAGSCTQICRNGFLAGSQKNTVGDFASYDLDFSKHAPKEQVPRVRMVWNSIPSQLFKENKKFIYGALRKGARANDFEMAIQWLVNAGLLYKVPRCTKPELPLDIYEDLSAFKLYMVDLGLWVLWSRQIRPKS